MANVVRVGDGSDHGGTVISSGNDNSTKNSGIAIVTTGGQHSCPIHGHGTTNITGTAAKMKINGKTVAISGSTAGCGASLIGGASNLQA